MITKDQSAALRRVIMRYARNRHQGLWILGELIGRKADSFDDVTEEEWGAVLRSDVRRALSLDSAAAWAQKMYQLKRRHEKEVLGQMELF